MQTIDERNDVCSAIDDRLLSPAHHSGLRPRTSAQFPLRSSPLSSIMSLVQRRRSKSRESKPTFGLVSGVESFWRNTIGCSPSSSSRQGSSSSRSSRPVLRVRSQCFSRRVEGDDGAARRLANLAYQGSDGDLSPCLWPASGGGGAGEGGGEEGSVRPPSPLREKSTQPNAEAAALNVVVDAPESARLAAAVAASSDQSQQQQQLLSPSNNSASLLFPPLHTHIPCAISTPSRYPGLGGGGGGPLFRSQSARGRRRTSTLPPTKPGRSSPLTTVSSSSQVEFLKDRMRSVFSLNSDA